MITSSCFLDRWVQRNIFTSVVNPFSVGLLVLLHYVKTSPSQGFLLHPPATSFSYGAFVSSSLSSVIGGKWTTINNNSTRTDGADIGDYSQQAASGVTPVEHEEEEAAEVMRKAKKRELLIQKGYGFPGENVCIYKRADGQWKRRRDISELRIGQRLFANRLVQNDLLDGKTGAKVFFECGVGALDSSGWRMINGMMRVGGRETKKSVVQKRLKRLKSTNNNSSLVEVYVSRINLEEKRFEVLPSYEEAINYEKNIAPRRIPVSSLHVGQELIGKIVRVEPYGAIIDVGANKNGLLHINTVAKLTGTKDVFKPNGLKELGIVRKSQVRVSVLSNDYKQYRNSASTQPGAKGKWARQLELDFTEGAKEEAERERQEAREKLIAERRAKWESRRGIIKNNTSAEEKVVHDNADEEYEEYDEDRALEESLGLDYY
jgi:predicted RNA-binding protein with RPS1 domain